jgi:pilus assembly protein Flp/PilA
MTNLDGLPAPIVSSARKAAGTLRQVLDTLARAREACGQGLAEYALILVLIAIVALGVLTELGGKTSHVFSSMDCTLAGGAPANTTVVGPGDSSSHTTSSSGSSATSTTTTGGC